MQPEEKINKELWAILQDLKHLHLTYNENEFTYSQDLENDSEARKLGITLRANSQRLMALLDKLQGAGAISWWFAKKHNFVSRNMADGDFDEQTVNELMTPTIYIRVEDKFSETYNYYSDEIAKSQTNESDKKQIALRLAKEGRYLYIRSDLDGETVLLNTFKPDMIPDLLMEYLLLNKPHILVHISDIKREVNSLAELDNISEVVRHMGFDKHLKDIFFDYCGKDKVLLKPSVTISRETWEEIKSKHNRD